MFIEIELSHDVREIVVERGKLLLSLLELSMDSAFLNGGTPLLMATDYWLPSVASLSGFWWLVAAGSFLLKLLASS